MNRSLTISWQDPMAAFDAGRNLAGIDYMKEMIAGRIAVPPIMKLMDYRLAEVGEGLAVFECNPGEQHYNPIGVVHGGLAMTLLDSAMGCCVHTRLPRGAGYTTLEVKVNLVRAITIETGLIRATGKVIHFGGKTATAEARLEDAAGKLYAHGTTTCLILSY
ncbi:MAG: PaaI family thioesterase [Burkholderiales bacterium]